MWMPARTYEPEILDVETPSPDVWRAGKQPPLMQTSGDVHWLSFTQPGAGPRADPPRLRRHRRRLRPRHSFVVAVGTRCSHKPAEYEERR